MSKPIEENATLLLISMAEAERELQSRQGFNGEDLSALVKLDAYLINNAVDYLHDRNLVERIMWKGTDPYAFGQVKLTSKGRVLYDELMQVKDISTTPTPTPSPTSGDQRSMLYARGIIRSQPIASGSPYGFVEQDWEQVIAHTQESSVLYVVMGYQFISTHYDSRMLVRNIQDQFETAIMNYNSRRARDPIELQFNPLAAGYGEHLFNRIARDIISSDISVFETSDLNPNVMIEMGVALTWGKRVLPIKVLGTPKPPSDISGQTWAEYEEDGGRFVNLNHINDLEYMIERAISRKLSKR